MEVVLLESACFSSSQLVAKDFPLHRLHPNKLTVYSKACPDGPVSLSDSVQLMVTRWARALRSGDPPGAQLQGLAARVMVAETLAAGPWQPPSVQPDLFDYPASTPSTVHWHVNFADLHLFGYYASALFAQDEMQAAEMPVLAHLREALSSGARDPKAVPPVTRNGKQPAPILVSGAERMVKVHTDPNSQHCRPYCVYGNEFGAASKFAVETATEVLQPPVISNILAMESVKYGQGRYTKEEVC